MDWRVGCLITFVVIIGSPIVASHYLPWWGTILFIIAEGVLILWGVPRLIKFAAKRFAMNLFTSKSRVLRGAMVQIHRVELAHDPRKPPVLENQDYPKTEAAAYAMNLSSPINERFILLEFTITPRTGASRMQFYEPGELLLIPFDAKIDIHADPNADENAGVISKCAVIDENGNESEDFDKITGRNKIRAIFKCPATLVGRVKLRYFFEDFGEAMLP